MTSEMDIDRLRSLIADLTERAHELCFFNRTQEINTYFDDLEVDVMTAVESGIKKLQNIQEELIKEINECRSGLLALSLKPAPLDDAQTSNHAESFAQALQQATDLEKSTKLFTEQVLSLLNENELSAEQLELTQFEASARCKELNDLKKKLWHAAFSDRLLTFNQNNLFALKTDCIGSLVYTDEAPGFLDTRTKSVNLVSERVLLVKENTSRIENFFLLRNGDIVTHGSNELRIWGCEDGKLKNEITCDGYSLAYAATTGLLFVGTVRGPIEVWDPTCPKKIGELVDHKLWIVEMSVLPNGNLVSCCAAGVLNAWRLNDLDDCKPHFTSRHDEFKDISFDSFSHDYLVFAFSQPRRSILRVANMRSNKLVRQMNVDMGVTDVLVLTNGQVVLSSRSPCDTVKIVDIVQMVYVRTLLHEEYNLILFDIFELPNGLLFGAYDQANKSVALLDPNSGEMVQSKEIKTNRFIRAFKSAKGEIKLVTGLSDNTLEIWSLNFAND